MNTDFKATAIIFIQLQFLCIQQNQHKNKTNKQTNKHKHDFLIHTLTQERLKVICMSQPGQFLGTF